MSYTLTDIMDYVRVHLDVDSEELPTRLLEVWAREGSRRVERARKRWPFFEYTWTLDTVVGQQTYDLSSLGTSGTNRPEQVTLVEVLGERSLSQLSREDAAVAFSTDEGTPRYWRVENETLYLYPVPDAVEAFRVHGFRKAARWVDGENASTVDLPEEMHDIVANWVLGRAYTHQDDPDQGVMFMDLADEELRGYVKRAPGGQHGGPIVMNAGSAVSTPTLRPPRMPWE